MSDFNFSGKVPLTELQAASEEGNQGFCLQCGIQVSGVEPDTRKYTCENCDGPFVYGAEEIILMGCYDPSR